MGITTEIENIGYAVFFHSSSRVCCLYIKPPNPNVQKLQEIYV
jgi:hypothetical protein